MTQIKYVYLTRNLQGDIIKKQHFIISIARSNCPTRDINIATNVFLNDFSTHPMFSVKSNNTKIASEKFTSLYM